MFVESLIKVDIRKHNSRYQYGYCCTIIFLFKVDKFTTLSQNYEGLDLVNYWDGDYVCHRCLILVSENSTRWGQVLVKIKMKSSKIKYSHTPTSSFVNDPSGYNNLQSCKSNAVYREEIGGGGDCVRGLREGLVRQGSAG